MKSLTLVWVVFIGTLAIPELDGRFLHDQLADPEPDCGRLLDSMPATQWYRVHPCRIGTHEIADLWGLSLHVPWRSQTSMADSSTAAGPILGLIAGDCWARRQLRSGIKDVSVASKLMISLTLVGVVFIGTLALPELDVRFLHNHWADPGPDCRRLLGSTPATQRYKGRVCRIETHEIADPCGGCLYRYPGAPRARCQIPPQPLGRSWIRLRGIVGLDAGYPAV